MATHELTTAGARTAYLPESLPALFEDQEPSDFSGPAYEKLLQLRLRLSGNIRPPCKRGAAAKSDPQWQKFSLPIGKRALVTR